MLICILQIINIKYVKYELYKFIVIQLYIGIVNKYILLICK